MLGGSLEYKFYKEILRHFYKKKVFKYFELLLANSTLKFPKKVLLWPKIITSAKFEYKYSKNAEFYADMKTVEKARKSCSIKTKLQAKKCQNLEFVLFSITNLLKFSTNNFLHVHLFPIISTDLESA